MTSRVLMVLVTMVGCIQAADKYWDYIVVGAGPGGLQMGHFLQKAGRNYVLLERNSVVASFFQKYPRHDKLISINKRHTGKKNTEFNLRHDWNSLLSDDKSLLFRHYSKLFFPQRVQLLDYMADYQKKLGINVQFHTEVSNIRKETNATTNKTVFLMDDQNGNTLKCKVLIVASGLSKPVEPTFEGREFTENYSNVSINPDDYEGKTVVILGRGNSAFELAESIYGSTNFIHMIGRSRVRLSWATHYVGDLRAVNVALLDTYQLKSLDAVLEATVHEEAMRLVKVKDRLKVVVNMNGSEISLQNYDHFPMRELYDKVIVCFGFQFDNSIFSSSLNITKSEDEEDKFPLIGYDYQLRDVEDLYIAGGASHGPDYRKSSGGFIHGFRYTGSRPHRMLEWKYEGVPWPSISILSTDLLATIIKRINEGSGFYQMFGMLGDVMAIRSSGEEIEYLEEVPVNLLDRLSEITGHSYDEVIVLILQYGANYSGPDKDVFRSDRATAQPEISYKSNFLHPVFFHYRHLPTAEQMSSKTKYEILPRPDHMHHIVEDFLTLWDAPSSHHLPLRRYLETVLDRDLRTFYASDCFEMAMLHQMVPLYCQQYYLSGRGIVKAEPLFQQS
ncbi:hypothetical protein NP493_113g04057 [Ridgeia piscesae]|uniref:FAD-dependent oxidoreductase domain-containing protein 2 n=1 Tax=Ridgeia piscesae TaxID=27915 RepID=A0AAD9P6U0_RIDPI|nr:hypothetical protein NP493_113g04057 [Ridgeia piscesae]